MGELLVMASRLFCLGCLCTRGLQQQGFRASMSPALSSRNAEIAKFKHDVQNSETPNLRDFSLSRQWISREAGKYPSKFDRQIIRQKSAC